jgi:hypothetical protein
MRFLIHPQRASSVLMAAHDAHRVPRCCIHELCLNTDRGGVMQVQAGEGAVPAARVAAHGATDLCGRGQGQGEGTMHFVLLYFVRYEEYQYV